MTHPDSVTQRYSRLARRVGVDTHLHCLRHYSATELIAVGVDIRTVAGRLGHAGGGSTTLRTYTAFVHEADQRAATALASRRSRLHPQPSDELWPRSDNPASRNGVGPEGPDRLNDARAVIDALADPETLYVFGVVAARTSKLGLPVSDRAGSTPYLTPFGLMRETCLSRDVVEAAAERLKRAGLLEVLVDDERGYESWRISEVALAAAATRTDLSRGA